MGISSHSPPILYGLPNIILSIIPTMHCTSTPIFTFDLFTQLRPCCVVFDIHIICLLVCLNFVHFEHTHTQYTPPPTPPAAWYLIYARLLCALVHYYSLLPDLPEGHNNLLLGTKLCLFQFSRSASVLFYFESHSQAGLADAGATFGFARLPEWSRVPLLFM